jgi:hypothetical protein
MDRAFFVVSLNLVRSCPIENNDQVSICASGASGPYAATATAASTGTGSASSPRKSAETRR